MSEPTSDAERGGAAEPMLTILLYSSDRRTRENVRFALGRRVAPDLPEVRVLEVATQPAVITAMDAGGIDLAILDGEAVPGGMGVARQLKDEIHRCPPILLLTGRPDDAWLATWSRADGAVPHPIDPVRLPEAAANLLGAARVSAATATRAEGGGA
jgi:DNA-binding NarL/FixJ family response regulator